MVDPKKFERLSILSQQFNQQCDTLNDTIEEWNKRLETLSLGQEVWLLVKSDEYFDNPENPDYEGRVRCLNQTFLGYDCVDGRWQLAIKDKSYTKDTDSGRWVPNREKENITRLLSASREGRILAINKLDELLDALEDKVTRGLGTVAKAQKRAELDKK